ncbi:vanillate O-demethylase ferredoxin subunit [Rhodobacter viridis]|uniref:Vanillate O-demethylase ferredoxin subunit n=1 Tax=Rhodobacter viridis TaxID=1054202 RepID=A0A318TW94_9RHOB|nr:2Fe-2S iron-sulfur cluster-binding protein [Rhodobacter viridis]PYF08160.1 vanillate O-demethylase ferredoxin subunit [Rhodobacter viridis]
MTGALVAWLVLAVPVGVALWSLGAGLRAWARGAAARRATTGLRLIVLWRDDPTPDLFRLWLIGWPGLLVRHAAGQHVMVSVPMPDGRVLRRAYSLAGWSRFPLCYTLAIRKGAAASAALHRLARPLRRLTVSPPRGRFTDPDPRAPLVLLAGGIGITPFRALIAERAAAPWAAPVVLHHSARTAGELLWRESFARLSARAGGFRYRPRLTGDGPRLTAADVLADLAPQAHVMLCAGAGLTEDLRAGLLEAGLAPDRLHIEAFSLALAAEDRGVLVTMGEKTFRPGPIGSLIEALEQGGIAPDSACRAGECGLCAVTILSGQARDLRSGALVSGRVRACSVLPETDLILAAPGR